MQSNQLHRICPVATTDTTGCLPSSLHSKPKRNAVRRPKASAGGEDGTAEAAAANALIPKEQMLVLSSDPDTSDEEHSRNTVGRIPLEWYDDLSHIGYDLRGKKVTTTHPC